MKRLHTLQTRPALAALAAALSLSACSLSPKVTPPAVYDLGPAPTTTGAGGALGWRIADVAAPPWLADEGIAYRLAYQQAQRQEHYRDSLWAAPPAALLTQRLREQLANVSACPGVPAGLLAVNLDEFEQVFSQPGSSVAVLRVHATLWPAGGAPALQRHWRVERPAAPDAAGAVRAMSLAVDDWLPQLGAWLTSGCAAR